MRPADGGGGGRPSDWYLVGYGSDPVPGDAGGIRQLAKAWHTLATELSTDARHLAKSVSAAAAPGAWEGDSGDSFRTDLGTVHRAVTKAHNWFADASSALTTWATAVETAQSDADRQLGIARTAQQSYDTAQSDWSTADATYRQLTYQPSTPGDDTEHLLRHYLHQRSNAQTNMDDAATSISNATTAVQHAKTHYDKAAKAARKSLEATISAVQKLPAIPGVGAWNPTTGTSWTVPGTITGSGGGDVSGRYGDIGGDYQYLFGGTTSTNAGVSYGPDGAVATAGGLVFFGAAGSVDGHFTGKTPLGDVTGGGSASGIAGALGSGTATAKIGGGNASVDANASVFAGAKGAASGEIGLGRYTRATGEGGAEAGASASADGHLSVGKDGVSATAGVDAMAGARAGGDVGASVDGADAKVGGGVRAGVGFEASAGGSIGPNDVSVKVNLGAALGVGGDVNLDVDIHPEDMAKDVGAQVKGVANDTKDITQQAGKIASKVWPW